MVHAYFHDVLRQSAGHFPAIHVGLHALSLYDDASADTFVSRVVVGQYRRLAELSLI